MGVSIYYSATRDRSLSAAESKAIEWIVNRYPLDALMRDCGVPESQFHGEGFCLYSAPLEEGAVLEGATKLPGVSEEAMWIAIQYWCRLLTELRGVLQDANWRVHVDDHHIPWSDSLQRFDPSG